jgi:bacteriochlorophyll 4-vinyl reductase
MREILIGRVLLASLHQGIADILPERLGFYENWLDAKGLREGTIGLAPFYAVLSFLRQEGDAYGVITARAGEYAAEWTVESMSPVQRSLVRSAPAWLRARLVVRLARQLVRDTYRGSRTVTRRSRQATRVDVRPSIFCAVREPVAQPLCGFYAAAFTRLQSLFGLQAEAKVETCRGAGGTGSVLHIQQAASPSAAAAGALGAS